MKPIPTLRHAFGRRASLALFGAWTLLGAAAQEPYAFHCRDYVSTDDARAPQSAFSYDDVANTFTVTAAGTNNIAFQMDKQKDAAYYIPNTQTLFLVEGTDLATTATASYVWWFNGYNRNGQTPPTYAMETGDGSTLVAWDIPATAGINPNMDYDSPTLLITSNGAQFIHALGLTSTAATGQSTISNVGYYAPWEAATTYPVLISALGYTEASLTEEIKAALSQAIQEAGAQIDGDADSDAKTAVRDAINTAQGVLDTAAGEAYADVAVALRSLRDAMESYRTNVADYSYEQTSTGIRARLASQYIHLMVYEGDILRVVKGYAADVEKKSLSVVATPDATVAFEVTEDAGNKTVTLSTGSLKAVYHLPTGQVEVLRQSGLPLLREKEGSSTMLATKDGPFDSYRIATTFSLDDDEQIYGMGQIQDGLLNRRGQTYSLAQDNMKVCIPYFLSTKGYALFWDNYSPTTFTDNADGARFLSTGTEIDYYVLAAEDGDGVVAAMRRLTGQSPMPALWNFGLYQSKERYTSTSEVKEVVDRYRALGVPLDCIVQDWQYWGDDAHWNALSFLNPNYADAEEMIDHVHGQNAKLMISIWANFGPQTEPYAELDAIGRLIPINSYPWNNGVEPYDVYDEGARDIYWKYLYNGLVSKGIDAYWMDSTEPDYTNWQESDLDYVSGEGRTWRSLRNAFPIAHVGGVATRHRALEAQADPYLAGKRVAILTRSAFAGQQRYGANTWSGDVTASWKNFAAQIPAACNLSACGIPYWNSDIGGFFTGGFGGTGDPNWRRLYMRWMQFGTFTPMMRFHGTNTPREIYQFGSEGDGLGDFDQILKYVKMRYRMLPYLYSTAWQVHTAGASFMRALPIAFGKDPDGFGVTDEYMFGQAFLVAPVVEDAANGRDVYLPAGTKWIDFWTGETLDGGQTVQKRAHMDIIPLYVKAGSILPWGPDVQYSTEKPWDDLEIRVYPGDDGNFTLYEDENDNYNYEQGRHSQIDFVWDDATQTLTIGTRQGEFDGMLTHRTFRIVKVSTRRGTGDLHTTRYDAVVEYDGTQTQVVLDSQDREVKLTDITEEYIQNPSFEADGRTLTKQAPTGWTVDCATQWWGVNAGGGSGDPVATDGNYVFGVWDGSNTAQADIHQTLHELPAGTYRLCVDMHATNRGSGTIRLGDQRLYAGNEVAYFREQVTTAGSNDSYPLQTISLDFTVGEGDAPVVGVTTSGAPAETWFKIDNFRLYRLERPTLLLDENTAYEGGNPGMTDIDFVRRLEADAWNTFCVPFSLDESETKAHFSAVKAFTSAGMEDGNFVLGFSEATRIEAGVPYLVKPVEATSRMTIADAVVEDMEAACTSIGGVNFIGTFSPTTVESGEYVLSADVFSRAQTPAGLLGFRAYVSLDAPAAQDDILHLTIDGKPTGFGTATAGRQSAPLDVHTLSGIRLRRGVNQSRALHGLPDGVYVVGGKKCAKH